VGLGSEAAETPASARWESTTEGTRGGRGCSGTNESMGLTTAGFLKGINERTELFLPEL